MLNPPRRAGPVPADPFRRHGYSAGDEGTGCEGQRHQLGDAELDVAHEGLDGGEPRIAGRRAVAAVLLQGARGRRARRRPRPRRATDTVAAPGSSRTAHPDARCRLGDPGGAATAVRSRARTFDTTDESLLRHGDPAFGEEICDIPETQAETVVEPDGVTDDFRGTSVSGIAGRLARHRPTLLPAAQLDNAVQTVRWHECSFSKGLDPFTVVGSVVQRSRSSLA